MKNFLIRFFCYFIRFILKLRYKVEIRNLNSLNKNNLDKSKGILFLPNHPAHIDPILIVAYLWPKFKLRPIVVEYVFRQSGVNLFMRAVKALSIPNFDTSLNEIKLKKAKETVDFMSMDLKKGDNFLIYPSGRLKHNAKEILGGSSATQTILSENPDVNIVLIRTTGLWGSMFSRAYTTRSPDLKSTMKRALKYLLKAFIFFMPRRKIIIEFEVAKENFPRHATRLEVNKYLENWYNNYPTDHTTTNIEPLNQVSYSPFFKKYLKVLNKDYKKEIESRNFKSKLEEEIYQELSKISKVSDLEIKPNFDLAQDLGFDSLDIAELITFLSVNYDIQAIHPEDIISVQDVLEIAEGIKKIEPRAIEETSDFNWSLETNRKNASAPMGNTLQESFFQICDKMKNFEAIADDLSGVLTYKKLKIASILLSDEIKKYSSKHVAVLLPSSVGAYFVIIAILLANKVPVMLNWTLGPRYLNHMMQVTKSDNVISSWKFLEKISNVEFGSLTKKISYLEDIKTKFTKVKKIKAFLKSFKPAKSLLKFMNLDKISENDEAVILFTSGTESNPKGVPLSHKNILASQKGAFETVEFRSSDVFLGILPPFHSFGFSIAGLFPILCGIKVAYYADPTNSYAVAKAIEKWGGTIICSAPSFLRGILQAGTKKELNSLRVIVTGAEKTSNDIFDKVKKLGGDKQIIEGYGITECAPVISINLDPMNEEGVGKPVKGVEIKIANPESNDFIDSSKEGEICIKGDNVFNGYVAEDKDPFIKKENEKWYRTGDLGYLNEEGNLILSGRIKRFTKVAGEMISLGAIEHVILDEILRRVKDTHDGPICAVVAFEKENKRPTLALFTVKDIAKQEVNNILKEAGFSRLVKITDVIKIDAIPLMGTGKIDYRYLQTLIE
jgi:long-chain-fatty-acid--[acyl-carrier-protein] ligase